LESRIKSISPHLMSHIYSGNPPSYTSTVHGAGNRTYRVPNHAPRAYSYSSEDTLLIVKRQHKKRNWWLLSVFIGTLVIGVFLSGRFLNFLANNPESWERDRVQYEADRELWESQKRVWQQDYIDHKRHSAKYNKDRLSWQAERDHMTNERYLYEKEVAMREEERRSWASETEQWERERGNRDLQRKQWEHEELRHHGRCPVVPAGAYWDEPTPAPNCHAYGKREYSARLRNIPRGWGWVDACNATPLMMHGISIRSPDSCEDLGVWGGVIGHWIVGFKERGCEPPLRPFSDVGCVFSGSKLRRIEAELYDIQPGEDWRVMCSTVPATINDVYYPSPSRCEDRFWDHKIAVWDISDPKC